MKLIYQVLSTSGCMDCGEPTSQYLLRCEELTPADFAQYKLFCDSLDAERAQIQNKHDELFPPVVVNYESTTIEGRIAEYVDATYGQGRDKKIVDDLLQQLANERDWCRDNGLCSHREHDQKKSFSKWLIEHKNAEHVPTIVLDDNGEEI